MKIKVIDYLGNYTIYEDVRNIHFTKRGFRIETRDGEWIWRDCTKFCSNVGISIADEFDHIITEW